MNSLKRKLIKLFKELLQLRQDNLKRSLNWTEEIGKCKMLMLLFMKLACSSNPRVWNSIRQINKLTDQTRREKSWLCKELEMRNKAFQEDRPRNCQDIEELRRICCAEDERFRLLKYDELSMQQREDASTVNQLLAQIQALQDKMNSLNDAKEFNDPETANSSGLSHVPSQPMSIPSPRGMTSRDSCLQPATRNSLGTSGHVFESVLVRCEPTSALFENSKNLASSSCRLTPIETGKIAEQREGLRKELQDYTMLATRLARMFATWNPLYRTRRIYSQNCMMETREIRSRTSISINSQTHQTSSVGRSISRLKYALTQDVLQSQCHGPKK